MGSKELTKKTIRTVASQSEDLDTNSRIGAIDIHIYALQLRYPLEPEALQMPHVLMLEAAEAMQ